MGLGAGDTEILVALGARPKPRTPTRRWPGVSPRRRKNSGAELAGGDVVASPVLFLSVTVIAPIDDETPVVGRGGWRGSVDFWSGRPGSAGLALQLMELEVSRVSLKIALSGIASCARIPDWTLRWRHRTTVPRP